MQTKYKIILIALGVVAIALSWVVSVYALKYHEISKRPELKVLFIGNSYTFFNDMPKMVSALSISDEKGPFRIHTDMAVQAGATLADLWAKPEIRAKLQMNQWDYIVLQPQSMWATNPMRTAQTENAVAFWVREINLNGAQPVFYMTWPREPNSHWYTAPATAREFKSPEWMYGEIYKNTKRLSEKYDLMTVPVGDYWVYGIDRYADVPLYAGDGSHSTPAGSYLVALLFYKAFANPDLSSIRYRAPNLTEAQQLRIEALASTGLK